MERAEVGREQGEHPSEAGRVLVQCDGREPRGERAEGGRGGEVGGGGETGGSEVGGEVGEARGVEGFEKGEGVGGGAAEVGEVEVGEVGEGKVAEGGSKVTTWQRVRRLIAGTLAMSQPSAILIVG